MCNKKRKYLSRAVIAVCVLAILIVSFIINPKETKAAINRDTITILEIEPTNNFKLTEKSNATSGEEDFVKQVNGKKIVVIHMTMAEYISKVEQVNGKYDVVVIGSYSGSYTAPFTNDEPGYLPFGKEVYGINRTTLGMKNNYVLSKDNNTYIEYYSENDITNKRANEILEFINSGQLAYIDTKALVNNTKINNNFGSLNNSNLIKTSNTNITVSNIVNKYISTTNKPKYRPILTVNTKPATTGGDRNINFTYNLNTENDNSVTVNLYLDLNGDGLFKDKELVKSVAVTPTNGQLTNGTISYNLQKEFVGRLDWKLEVVTQDNVKAYEQGYADYGVVGTIPVIRVLQIAPNGNILDLSADSGINSLIRQVGDYTIHIDKKSVDYFNTNAGSALKLNGNYDMVILGFEDSFGSEDLSPNAIAELKSFINTGQSVMFTHDTLTYRILPNIDINTTSSKNMTHAFRDILGQARYKDVQYNSSEADIYRKYNVTTGAYESRQIPHDTSSSSSKITYGNTDGILKMFDSNSNAGSYSGASNSVYKINNGLINEYPFSIGDISVADTHYQWYQLNLEDEDVVPWYTLKPNGNGYNQYDARNYYYTYSKGNLTYSGTGHSNGFTTDEKKLFVNTMVKASRGANHAPTIQVANLDNNVAFSKNQNKIDFTVTPYDIDNDKLTTTIAVKDASGNLLGQSVQYLNQNQGVPISVSLKKSANYNKLNVDASSMSVEIDTVDPLGAEATETRTVKLVNDPTISLNYTTDKPGYLKGDTAAINLIATANPGDLNGTISNIIFTPNPSDKYTLGSNILNYNNVIFNANNPPNPESQSKTMNVTLNNVGNIVVSGTLTYEYNGNTVTISNYSIPLVVQEGIINISIIDDSKQLVSGGEISVTSPNNKIPSTIYFDGNIETYNDLSSGNYSFTLKQSSFMVNGIKYTLSGDQTKSLDLQYDANNPVKNVEFNVTSTGGPTSNVTYENSYGLKGETVPVKINLEGVSGESVGTISHVKLKLTNNSSGLSFNDTTNSTETVSFDDMTFDSGASSVTKTSSVNVNLLKEGNYTIQGELSYTQTVGGKDRTITKDYPISFEVKTGSISGAINVIDSSITTGTPALNQPATINLKNSTGTIISTISTSSNSYQFSYNNSNINIVTGKYTVEVMPIDGYEITPGNSVDMNVSFESNSSTQDFTFRRINPTLIHGLYNKGSGITTGFGNLTKGTYATFGIEASSYGSNPIVKLQLDKNLEPIAVNSGNFKIYNLNDIDVQGNPKEVDITNRINQESNSDNKAVYDITLGNGESYKHYIITYMVKLGDDDSYTNDAAIIGLNDPVPVNITCGDLQDLF